MRVRLDECLPRRLKQAIVGYDVATVSDAGWSGKSNGGPLGSAFFLFDVTRHDDERFWIHQPLAVGLTRIDGDHQGVYHRAERVRAGLCIDLHRRRQDRCGPKPSSPP